MKMRICMCATIVAFLCAFAISSPAIATTHDGYSIWALDDQCSPAVDATMIQSNKVSTSEALVTPAANNSPPAATCFVSYSFVTLTSPAAFQSTYTIYMNRAGPPASACANCGTDIYAPRPTDANLVNGFWHPDSDVRDQTKADANAPACTTRRYDDINMILIPSPTGAEA